MSEHKSFIIDLAETIERHLPRRTTDSSSGPQHRWLRMLGRQMVPNVGTLILVAIMLLTIPAIAAPYFAPTAASITTIPYQGRLADAAGLPITSRQNMEFRLYDTPTSNTSLWAEFWTGGNAVNVSDGLFSVMLGSINTGLSAVVQSHSELYLGITIGTDTEMSPRVQLGSVPFSLWSLTVADNSITAAKIAASVITTTHLANGSVTQAKLGADVSLIPPDGSITTAKIADGAVTSDKLKPTVGMAFMSSGHTLNLGPQWTRVTIPETSFAFNVTKPSKMLLSYASTFATSQTGGRDLILMVDETEKFVSTASGTSAYYNYGGTIILDLAPGTHSVRLEMQSSVNDDVLSFLARRTAITYQLVSQ
jgi:hypothetical protein